MKPIQIDRVVKEIRLSHQAAMNHATEAVKHVLKCGRLLAGLRDADGEWEKHLEGIGISRTTAWRYIKVAKDASRNPARTRWLLEQGASLVDLYREFDLVKPVTPGGYKSDVYQRRKLGEQLELDFSYEEFAGHLKALVKAPNVEELSESSLKKLDRELAAAKARVESLLKEKSAVDVSGPPLFFASEGRSLPHGKSPTQESRP